MGGIADVYDDLDTDVPREEFEEAVTEKVAEMDGLADEETAAMLIAHDLDDDGEVEGIADIEPGMEEAKFLGKVTSVGELREFERDGEDEPGQVMNVELADETGSVRAAFWDEAATGADEELEVGDVLRVAGRPQDGYRGTEVSVDRVEPDDADIELETGEEGTVEALRIGQSDVTLTGLVLDTDTVRTFERDDGSEGKVSNLVVGDETGRVRITLWDEQAARATELDSGTVVEIVDGYVREREGDLELHVGGRGAVEEIDADIEYQPESTPIDELEIDTTADIAGVVRSVDEKRTFERDDGSDGQVRNIRIQDDSGDIRTALWGEKADMDVGPGDEIQLIDAEVQDGWREDLEASAGWGTTVTVLESTPGERESGGDGGETVADTSETTETTGGGTNLDSFGGASSESGRAREADGTSASDTTNATKQSTEAESSGEGESAEFTGTVVQAGDPVVLDDGAETVSVETSANVHLGEEITVRGTQQDGRIDAEDVF